jgi:hypothetical protein
MLDYFSNDAADCRYRARHHSPGLRFIGPSESSASSNQTSSNQQVTTGNAADGSSQISAGANSALTETGTGGITASDSTINVTNLDGQLIGVVGSAINNTANNAVIGEYNTALSSNQTVSGVAHDAIVSNTISTGNALGFGAEALQTVGTAVAGNAANSAALANSAIDAANSAATTNLANSLAFGAEAINAVNNNSAGNVALATNAIASAQAGASNSLNAALGFGAEVVGAVNAGAVNNVALAESAIQGANAGAANNVALATNTLSTAHSDLVSSLGFGSEALNSVTNTAAAGLTEAQQVNFAAQQTVANLANQLAQITANAAPQTTAAQQELLAGASPTTSSIASAVPSSDLGKIVLIGAALAAAVTIFGKNP